MAQTLNPVKIKNTQLHTFLEYVVQNKYTHALWLNTLSLLEHLGSRKILMTQSNENISEMILKHATEEARHALFFKKAARNIVEDFQTGYQKNQLIKGTSAKIYFAKLDCIVRSNLRNSNIEFDISNYLAYLYTTTVIEKRAMIVYENYNYILESSNQNLNLRNLILEEEGHLAEMSAEMKKYDSAWETRLEEIIEREKKIFKRFLNQLSLTVV